MHLFDSVKFDLAEIKDLIARKEIRKPITSESMFKNWVIAKQEREDELARTYYGIEVNDAQIEGLINSLDVHIS